MYFIILFFITFIILFIYFKYFSIVNFHLGHTLEGNFYTIANN